MHPRDARVVVTSPSRQRRSPIVHMDMLHLGPPSRDSIRHPDVVQLLCVLVEDVRVPFRHWHFGDFVNLVHEAVERFEHRTCLNVLVVVSRDDDASLGVQFQE